MLRLIFVYLNVIFDISDLFARVELQLLVLDVF
jgi:hypothetical protein